jgi:hypothetical protein
VSGSPIVLHGAAVEPLLAAVGRVVASGVEVVLIGGLAVNCRLGQVHRPTLDVDFVADETRPSVVELLVDRGVAELHDRYLLADGAKVELIETEPLDTLPPDVDDPYDRLFVLAHRWAFETATSLTVMAGRSTITAQVATAGALVAAKLGAVVGTRREARKRASDAFDLLMLLRACDDVADLVQAGPPDLPELVAMGVRRVFIDEVGTTMRHVRAHGGDWGPLTDDDFVDEGTALLARLERPRGSAGRLSA